MTVAASELKELHHIHQRIAELQGRLDRGPKQVQNQQKALDAFTAAQAKINEAVQQNKLTIDRKQLDLKTGEQKVIELKGKLNTASSNKEYQALLEQIDAAEMAGSVLADEILEAMEKADALQEQVEAAKQQVQTGERELAKVQQQVESTAEEIRRELADYQLRLVDAEKIVPSEFRAEYERLARRKGADALAEVEDDVCGGCSQQITLNMMDKLRLSQIVICKNCGCILYFEFAQ